MSGYSIVLAPMGAIMALDYFVVKRGRIDVKQMYDPNGIYRYSKGVNWRPFVAVLISLAPTLPGLIKVLSPKVDIGNFSYTYALSNIVGVAGRSLHCGCVPVLTAPVGCAVHLLLNRIFPSKRTLLSEMPDSVERDLAVHPSGQVFGSSEEKDLEDQVHVQPVH